MDIEEVQRRRRQAEKVVAEAIKAFEDETTCMVKYVAVERAYCMGDPRREGSVVDVIIDVVL